MNEITVTKIEQLTKGKIRVSFDTGLTCILYKGEAYRTGVAEDAIISEAAYQEIKYEIIGKRAKKRAMHLLEKMDRTEANLRDKLKQNGYPDYAIDDALEYVKSYRYVDDERYAETFVRLAKERKSKKQLKMDLYAKGISRDLVDQALENEYDSDEDEQIKKWLVKRHFDSVSADDKERQKTYQFLMRKGFESSDILRCMKMNLLDSDR